MRADKGWGLGRGEKTRRGGRGNRTRREKGVFKKSSICCSSLCWGSQLSFHPPFLCSLPLFSPFHFFNQLFTHLYHFTSPFSTNIRFFSSVLPTPIFLSPALQSLLHQSSRIRDAGMTHKCIRQILIDLFFSRRRIGAPNIIHTCR